MTMDTASSLIEEYLRIRDHLDREQKAFQVHCAQFRERLEVLENKLLEMLNTLGGDGKQSIKTESGTCFKSVIVTPKVVDRDAYLDAVMDNYPTWGAGMLQLRDPKKESIDQYRAENDGKLPPGVDVSAFIRVNVRRPT